MKDEQNYLKNSENNTSEAQNLANGSITLREVVADVPRSFNLAEKVHEKLTKIGVTVSKQVIYNTIHRGGGDPAVYNAIIETVKEWKVQKNELANKLAEVAAL